MQIFKGKEREALRMAVVEFNNWLVSNVSSPIMQTVQLVPQELEKTSSELSQLIHFLSSEPSEQVDSAYLPILKKAIIHQRRDKATNIEERSEFTFNHELRIRISEELEPLSSVMRQEWFSTTELPNALKITNFLSIQRAEELLKNQGKMQLNTREYDEKFHILNAPTLLLPDLAYFRAMCELRSVPVCVCYLDIDDFKEFNTQYGEPRVDREVLPKFMSALEAHVYSHGYAYRFGGDEYMVILTNMSIQQAINFMVIFQQNLEHLDYFQIEKHTEVSIGIVEVTENSYQTDREIQDAAAFAKNHAKKQGKNCIATFKGISFASEEIYVVPNNIQSSM